ncbi:uroporphyrinogen-III synthase [Yoonia sp.]|uniref:uroporphyrinogen-III synthase n=1 Tax=Yoonia sp. TaxID=2212373 RepID=UPI002FDA5ACE
MIPTLLLTRPEGRNDPFAGMVRAQWHGPLDVLASPLLEISFVAATPPKADALIFTSVNGVAAAGHLGLTGHPAWCVGDRTAEVARDAGFAAETAQGDAKALVAHIIAAQPTGRLAHIRGIHARGDVARTLNAAGLICEDVVAYDQLVGELTPEAKAVLAGQAPVVAPLFSPRTATILTRQGPFEAPLHIAVMSDAVRDAIEPLAVAELVVAESPDAASMAKAVLGVLSGLGRPA